MYWHVDDLGATVARLLSMGATEYQPTTPRGEAGFVTAAVADPFGNVLGVMYNPHYVQVLNSIKPAYSRPVNVLARSDLSLLQLVDAGAQRISVGGALILVAAAAMASATPPRRSYGCTSWSTPRPSSPPWTRPWPPLPSCSSCQRHTLAAPGDADRIVRRRPRPAFSR
jgi:hypothetical protein